MSDEGCILLSLYTEKNMGSASEEVLFVSKTWAVINPLPHELYNRPQAILWKWGWGTARGVRRALGKIIGPNPHQVYYLLVTTHMHCVIFSVK